MKKLLRVLGRLFLALLFLAAAALVTLGLLRWRGLILLPDEADPDEWEVFGVDVSSYQGEGLARPGGAGGGLCIH